MWKSKHRKHKACKGYHGIFPNLSYMRNRAINNSTRTAVRIGLSQTLNATAKQRRRILS